MDIDGTDKTGVAERKHVWAAGIGLGGGVVTNGFALVHGVVLWHCAQ